MKNRNEHKKEIISALTEAQKLAFAPLTFHAIASMLDLGILKAIDEAPQTIDSLKEKLELSEYTVSTLLEIGEVAGILKRHENNYAITSVGQDFLYDDMTIVNFNFVKDVCYSGAEKLTDSFKNAKPEGLKCLFPNAETIYPYLSKLPNKMRKSWYEFDHFYSDNCFDIISQTILSSPKIFDIGGNTGIFERLCLKKNPEIDITMIDLKENIDFIKDDKELENCKFHAANILDEKSTLPQMSGAILMSQFLDCFSKEQIVFILKRLIKSSDKEIKIYILEPFIDKQKFAGAKHALTHISLYFTCMANGCSKMYSFEDMSSLIESAGLKISKVYDNIGAHDYTLLECIKND